MTAPSASVEELVEAMALATHHHAAPDDKVPCDSCLADARRSLTAICAKIGVEPEGLAKLGQPEPTFPVMSSKDAPTHHKRIPMWVAAKAYAGYCAKWGDNTQKFERIADRGGFWSSEMDDLYPQWRTDLDELQKLRTENATLEDRMGRLEEALSDAADVFEEMETALTEDRPEYSARAHHAARLARASRL